MNKKLHQKGQILLVVVLLLATTLTIVMTVVFTSRTETKVTKLQQDADRSLVAAEAGIEAAIKNQTANTTETFGQLQFQSSDLTGIDLNNSKVQVKNNVTGNFVSPIIQKDQQYTLFLAQYDNGTFGGPLVSGNMTVYYGSDGGDCNSMALELSFITLFTNKGVSVYTTQRYVADIGGILGPPGAGGAVLSHSVTADGVSTAFNCAQTVAVPGNAILLFTRVIGDSASTRIGVEDASFPAQGKTFYSEAHTTSGVVKKIKVFQSYPQIPAELFVTSFTTSAIVN